RGRRVPVVRLDRPLHPRRKDRRDHGVPHPGRRLALRPAGLDRGLKGPETGLFLYFWPIPLSIGQPDPGLGGRWARSAFVETLRTSRDRALRPLRINPLEGMVACCTA